MMERKRQERFRGWGEANGVNGSRFRVTASGPAFEMLSKENGNEWGFSNGTSRTTSN